VELTAGTEPELPEQRVSFQENKGFLKKGRPRKGDQRGTKPRSRPLAPIGGSSATHFRVITRCINETGWWFHSRFSMSELGQSGLSVSFSSEVGAGSR
jgi:hypothetical protein